jgi:hypothetical protein
MKVHFASGEHLFPPPWVNVDLYCPSDLAIDLNEEFPDSLHDIECAYVGHYLEHITPKQGKVFLRRVRERMAPGGTIHVVGPDVYKGEEMYHRGLISAYLREHIGRCIIEGDKGGESHYWDCHAGAVVRMLEKTGWSDVEELPILWLTECPMINSSAWQFYVRGEANESASNSAVERAA